MDTVYFHPTNLGVYTHVRPRFWKRQFGDAPTREQFRFDVAFGLVIPVLCFVFDPIVFRGSILNDEGIYQRFRLIAYAASAIEMATLACWLFLVRKFPAWSRPAGGVLAAGAFFSFALGAAILPFSVVGLLFAGLGALGFIPFVTGIVYLRNARRALRLNRTGAPVSGGAAAAFAFGLALALGAPAAAQRLTTRVIKSARADLMTAGGEVSPRRGRVVRALALVSGETFEDMLQDYYLESNPERSARIAHAYSVLTGRDIKNYSGRREWMGD